MKRLIAISMLLVACSSPAIQEPTTRAGRTSSAETGADPAPPGSGEPSAAAPSTSQAATPQWRVDGPTGCVALGTAPLEWVVTMADSGPSPLQVVTVTRDAPDVGCLRAAEGVRERARLFGVAAYPRHTTGRTVVALATPPTCGRTRVEVLLIDADGRDVRALDVVVDTRVACAPPPDATPGVEAVLVGAGDIGWCGSDGRPDLTAALLDGIPGTVFTTGDNAYMNGSTEAFRRCYAPSWGRHVGRTRPTAGNHDYETPGAAGYYGYFGANAGPAGLGYYAYRAGAWQVLALNSQLDVSAGSPQLLWLRAELAANPTRCTLAYFHEPLFGSGTNGSDPRMRDAWRVLYEAGADVVISGHNHSYERFAEQDPEGRFDPGRGMREFVVGTGGAPLTGFPAIQPNSEARGSAWGVLKLTLRSHDYRWDFVPVAGAAFSDAGTGACH